MAGQTDIKDDSTVDTRRKANWARLVQNVYEGDPLECAHAVPGLEYTAVMQPLLRITR